MPSFDTLKLTANGLALQANAQAGSQLMFSKIKLGKGTSLGKVSDLTDLVYPVIEAGIITGTLAENTYTVQANATNDGLTDGFYWTEIGLFAYDNNGNEVLYAYSSTTDETDYIPSESESSYLKRVKVAIVVGNATELEFVKSVDTYVDVLTFNETIAGIKTSLSDINKLIDSCATTKELDAVKSEIEKQIEDATKSISDLEKSVAEEIKSIKENYATSQSVTQMESDLGNRITELSNELESFKSTQNQNIINISNRFSNLDTVLNTMQENINTISDKVNAIPSITSGTANPSGGKDGDVYIQHE